MHLLHQLAPIVFPVQFSIDTRNFAKFSYRDNRLSDKFYPGSSVQHGTYSPQIFRLDEETPNDRIIEFADHQNLTLPGARGMICLLTGSIQLAKTKLEDYSVSDTIVFPDKKDFLYKKDGAWRVPYLKLDDTKPRLHVNKWKANWYAGKMVCLFQQTS